MAERLLTFQQAEAEALCQEMRRDPNVIFMGEDIVGGAGRAAEGLVDAWGGPFGTYKGLVHEFGEERVRDTPISEAGFIGAAVGAAVTGLRPIVELMFCDFVGVCLDQIFSNCAKMRYMFGGKVTIPFTLIARTGAGNQMGAQHSQSLHALFAHIPGLKVVTPSDPYTAKGLLTAAIRDDDPVVYLQNKLLSVVRTPAPVPEDPYIWPIGKARVLKTGSDVTLVGMARTTQFCVEAARVLEGEGINAEIIDLLSLSPIDYDTVLTSVRKTHRIVVVDEDTARCNVASEVVAIVADEAFDSLDAPPKRVSAPHTCIPYSAPLEAAYMPDAPRIVAAARSLVG